jgi:hypothetical protein
MPSPHLPFELHLTLRSGTVYYFAHRGLSSVEPHFFAVINADPRSNDVLIMAVGSSQIAKVQERRKNLPPETLVIVDPVEYPDFSKPTVIDCNQVFELSREELVQKFKTQELRHHRDLPKAVLEKIWRGVRISPRVDEIYKQMLPPEPGGSNAGF